MRGEACGGRWCENEKLKRTKMVDGEPMGGGEGLDNDILILCSDEMRREARGN